MPRWSKNTTEFVVFVHYSKNHGNQITVPKPVMLLLLKDEPNNLKKTNKIIFKVKKSKVEVEKV